jgi:hypothetical protein
MYDNNVNYLGDAANASTKIILAVVMLAVTIITVSIRFRNPKIMSSPGKAFYVGGYFLSFGLALVLAFLGGVILYGF